MSLISAMPPTDLILKHETQSPHSLSNLSSPNTNGAGHFSPNQLPNSQSQQPPTVGASAGNNTNAGFPYFGGVSPTEGSTASDSSQTGTTTNLSNPCQPTVPIGATGPAYSSLEDDFGLNLHSQASTSGNGGNSYPPSQHLNLPSPVKSMQLHHANQQQFCSPQLPHQFNPHSSDGQLQHQTLQQHPYFQPSSQGSTPPQYSMPHPMSHPGFFGPPQPQPTPPASGQTINIRNPFEEDENCRPVSHPGSTRHMPNSSFDYCHQSLPIPPNIHFEQYRQNMCLNRYPIGPGTCPQALWEQEKAKLPFSYAGRQRFPRPYPVPIVRSQMIPMMRPMPPFMMTPNGLMPIHPAMAAAAAAKCSPGQFPMEHGFVGYPQHMMPPCHTMPQNQRPSSIGAVGQQAPNPAKQTANAKKKEKAASKRASKEAAAVAAQASIGQMAAAAQMQGQFGSGMVGGPCSMMNGMAMMPQPDSSSCLSAQRISQMPINGNTPSPHFKVPVCSPPLQRPNKLLNPRPEIRLSETGDCFKCRTKINMQNRGIRCTAIGQGCGQVFHFECAKMMPQAYLEFIKDTRLEWICENCSKTKPCALSISY